MQDQIKKTIELKAPVSRVWRALTDYKEFGQWFQVELDGPFVVGSESTGQMTHSGCEHLSWRAMVEEINAESLFAFSWHPHGGDPNIDYSNEPTTRVEFRLEPTDEGTRLTIIESGFAAFTDQQQRHDALRDNTKGWDFQATNIADHVER